MFRPSCGLKPGQANANASMDKAERPETAFFPQSEAATTVRYFCTYLANGREGTAKIPANMNLSLPDQNMHSSIEGCLEDDKPEVILPCFRRNLCEEPLAPYSNGSIISQLLRKTIHNKRVLDENHFYFSGSVATADCGQEDQSSVSSKDSTVEAVSPSDHTSSGASPEGEHLLTDHLQAKRARVENIIRVMAGSPNSRQHCDSERSDTDAQETREARESFRENKRKQRLPQHQDHSTAGWQIYKKPGRSSSDSCNTKEEECHKLKEQLHSMQRLLRQLQEKFLQVYSQEDPEYEAGDATGVDSEHDILGEGTDACYINPGERFETNNHTVAANCKDRMKAADYLVHQRETPNLQETLKQELSKAVNDCIDRVFKNVSKDMDMSPQQCVYSSPEVQINLGTDRKSSPPDHSKAEEMPAKSGSSEYCESSETQTSQDQTEALSLVVRKPPVTQVGSVTPTVKRPYPMHQTPFQFSYTPPLHESHILEHLLKYGPHSNFGALPCMPPSMDRTSPDSVDLSWDAVAMRSKVTSSHFGHHHHRSSMGTFNRCITSQLIKWFSNFREFYYIQMEKFARQAIAEGVRDVKDITVSRDCELFRALNMHYNKANDFHVGVTLSLLWFLLFVQKSFIV
ncbi:hypothetical protein GOODEAATRI_013956 [Goodea atripinnis]|uniref:Prospero domain-containing protein n=1 Tax=Goodea atripinnis TaxID=208336 RepID=A0ABV0PNE2_9TELE